MKRLKQKIEEGERVDSYHRNHDIRQSVKAASCADIWVHLHSVLSLVNTETVKLQWKQNAPRFNYPSTRKTLHGKSKSVVLEVVTRRLQVLK